MRRAGPLTNRQLRSTKRAVFSSSYSWQNVKEQAKAEGKYMDEEAIKENLRDAFSEQDIMDKDLDQMTREELLPKSRTCGKASVSIATVTDTNFVGTTLHFGVYCQKRQIRFRWYRTGRSSLRAV